MSRNSVMYVGVRKDAFSRECIVTGWFCFLGILLSSLIYSPVNAAWLGVGIQDYDSGQKDAQAIEVLSVRPDGPAAHAGLRPGDVILSADKVPVGSAQAFANMIDERPAGSVLLMEVSRGDSRFFLVVTLTHLPEDMLQYLQGKRHFDKDRYDLAIDCFTKAIEIQPELRSYTYRAAAYSKAGLYDEAILDYTKAIDLAPKDPSGYYGRCLAALEKGQLDYAIADCTKSIELNPESVRAYNTRGLAFLRTREPDKAIADFTRGISLDPRFGALYTNRGVAHAAKGDYDRALSDIAKVIELYTQDPQAYLSRGSIYKKMGKSAEAQEDYDLAARAYLNRGLIFAKKGQYDEAIYNYNEGIKLDSRYSSPLYYNRGISNEKRGLPVQALLDYKEAINRNPEFAMAYLRRGFVHAQILKEYENARKDWEKAASLDRKGKTGQIARRNLERLKQRQ